MHVINEDGPLPYKDGFVGQTTSYVGLGIILLQAGRIEEAKAQLQKAQQVCAARLGKDHPHTIKVRTWLMWCTEKYEAKLAI